MHLKVGSICRLNLPRFEGEFVICKVVEMQICYNAPFNGYSGLMIFVEMLIDESTLLVEPEWLQPTGSGFYSKPNSYDNEFSFFSLQSDEAFDKENEVFNVKRC